MYEDLHGVPLYCQAAYPYSQGTGLMLGLAAGGQLHGGDKYLGLFGSVMADAWSPAALDLSLRLDVERRAPWELYVNAHGRRFIREDHPSVHARELSLRDQPGNRFWVVFDERALTSAPDIVPGWDERRLREAFADHPMFFSASTPASLATRAGIHPLELQRSLSDYNARLRGREPDALGRQIRPASIDTGPYYAIQCQSWTLVSFAGLMVDEQLRVVRADGSPVPNLYAAGEVLGAGATSGKAYVGGSLVTPALTFGRLLGQGLSLPG
jgi:fumarate reductase flavoprotein subunit